MKALPTPGLCRVPRLPESLRSALTPGAQEGSACPGSSEAWGWPRPWAVSWRWTWLCLQRLSKFTTSPPRSQGSEMASAPLCFEPSCIAVAPRGWGPWGARASAWVGLRAGRKKRRVDGWADGCAGLRVDGWVAGWAGGWRDGWVDGCISGWVDGCMDEWAHGWKDGAMGGSE